MTWLNCSDDEVARFHPEFQKIADDVLKKLGIDSKYHWEHHLSTAGTSTVPDFVLLETATNRWQVAVEIKRSRSSVFSERSQIQAKGYAENNQTHYAPSRGLYFCVTNMEVTILFAVNGSKPVHECHVANMSFESGLFASTPESNHKAKFQKDLSDLVQYVLKTPTPTFDSVWTGVVKSLLSHADSLSFNPIIDLNSGLVPPVVSDYFSGGTGEAQKRELLLRCLLAEYLKGLLIKYAHKSIKGIPSLGPDVVKVANIIASLKKIDFSGIFEATAPNLYEKISKIPKLKGCVEAYLEQLIKERVDKLAVRGDALNLSEIFITIAYSWSVQKARGKARTDPDLAALLAALTIGDHDVIVYDPGCGDGNLLDAAYQALNDKGLSHEEILAKVRGIDADPLAAKIAALRLSIKNPYVVKPTDPNHILPGDMFSATSIFEKVNVVLMNPPFKRYENKDDFPIPRSLRQHFHDCIKKLSGNGSVETDVGQANIYNLYVEFVIKASNPDTVLGIILDNRWYHNKSSKKLRELLLRECEVIAVVSYPYDPYFEEWTIATSMLIARKKIPTKNHEVTFIRTNDPNRADFNIVAEALRGKDNYPPGWMVRKVLQNKLNGESWQQKTLNEDFRPSLPTLDSLFSFSRSGRLDREGGGTELYALPFNKKNYGVKRIIKPSPRTKYQTLTNGPLTPLENKQLQSAAKKIPKRLRGYALVNSDSLSDYRLTVVDVTKDEVLEAPEQRKKKIQPTYFKKNRRKWDVSLDKAVDEIKSDPRSKNYISLVETMVGLNETVLSRSELWHGLREPYAGELIIPRKLRVGHRVHINPFAYSPTGRQVRISSNFFHYYNCKAIDPNSNLTREIAVELIFAFLMSSFGQLQFEMEAFNREGARSIEQHQLKRIRVFDPRLIRPQNRQAILNAAAQLPYPVSTELSPYLQPELLALDELFAEEIVFRDSSLNRDEMLDEVHQTLFEWLEARRQ